MLRGNLAPRGAVLKPSAATPKLMKHKGRAVVFEDIDDLHKRIDDPKLDVDPSCVLVLKNCGPKGYPGFPEVGNFALPAKMLKQGVTDMVRMSDARMSGTAYGTVVLHTAPEAAAGGPLALVRERRRDRARRGEAPAPPARVRRGARAAPRGVEGAEAAFRARLGEALLRHGAAGGRGRGPRLPGRQVGREGRAAEPLTRVRDRGVTSPWRSTRRRALVHVLPASVDVSRVRGARWPSGGGVPGDSLQRGDALRIGRRCAGEYHLAVDQPALELQQPPADVDPRLVPISSAPRRD